MWNWVEVFHKQLKMTGLTETAKYPLPNVWQLAYFFDLQFHIRNPEGVIVMAKVEKVIDDIYLPCFKCDCH